MSMSSYCNEAEVFSCSELLDYCDLRFPDEDLNGSADPTPQSTLKAGLDGGTRKRYPFAKKKVCHLGFKTLKNPSAGLLRSLSTVSRCLCTMTPVPLTFYPEFAGGA